jgi:transcriptional regulator with XRE-family HTH domain
MTDVSTAFAANLKRLRRDHGWSQRVLAEWSGVSNAAISAIEGGNNGPSLAVAAALAKALGTGLDAMTAGEPYARGESGREV